MNIIEQFGSYENARAELKDKYWKRDNLHGSSDFTWHIKQHIQLLEAILLQYRRENNIFEKDDLVVYEVTGCVGDFIDYVESPAGHCRIDFGLCDVGLILLKHIKHATYQEIEQ